MELKPWKGPPIPGRVITDKEEILKLIAEQIEKHGLQVLPQLLPPTKVKGRQVVEKSGRVVKTHPTRAKAVKHARAINTVLSRKKERKR